MIGMKKFAATALLTIGATGLAAGTAYAQPAAFDRMDTPTSISAASGIDHGIAYTTAASVDGTGVTTTLADGLFTLTRDNKAVTITDRNGAVVTTLPMAFRFAGRKFDLRPTLDLAGRKLTLTPVGLDRIAPAHRATAKRQFIDAASDLARHQYNAGVGALIGLGIGVLIGLFFFGVGAIPGGLIGAGIGALIGWTQP